MSFTEAETTFDSWREQFVGIDEAVLHRYFLRWQHLVARARKMRIALSTTKLLPEATKSLGTAERKLDFSRPYRIVVLGESGAGKSTIINALLGQDRLTTGAGAAITGTPVYVHPLKKVDDEYVLVTYRDQPEMLRLAMRIAQRYGVELPSTLQEISAQLTDIINTSTVAEEKRSQLVDDLQDIIETATKLEARKLSGENIRYSPKGDARFLAELMDETSPVNAKGSASRMIAGILRIDFFVHSLASSAESQSGSFASVVFVDTPGIGARTVRHQEILEDEVENADAVILVVNANRPEDKTAGMAHLLSQALLGVFSPERKEYFAQKVFVVVNKVDALSTNDDRRRLDQSVTELSRIISPNYWSLHVAGSTDPRYFETIGQLAVLAQYLINGQSLDPEVEKIFLSYTVRLLTEAERTRADAVEVALAASKVPIMRLQLATFLSQRRVDLMLREAEEHLSQTVRTAQEETKRLFARYDLVVDDRADSEVLVDRNARQLCLKQLDSDERALAANYRQLWNAMQAWRQGSEYKVSLTGKVTEICSDIDFQIDKWLEGKLADQSIFTLTLDTTTGRQYTEMNEVRFLYEAERETRRLVEHEGAVLADYYLAELHQFILRFRIYDLIIEKAYGQSYLFDTTSPESGLHLVQDSIAEDFADICRWVSVYELMQNPLLAPTGRNGEFTPEVASEVSKYVIEIIAASFNPTGGLVQTKVVTAATVSGVGRLLSSFGKKSVKAEAVVPDQETISSVELRTAQRREFSNKLQDMQRKIAEALKENDIDKIRQLVGRELAIRCKNALGDSLPYLDMLFFYELEKFQRMYESTVQSMMEEHRRQVLDRNEDIRRLIVRQNRAVIDDLNEALAVIKLLRTAAA